jgi:ABC-2 type transport system permease protein
MVGTIIWFEIRQRLRRISTYIYFLVFFALGFLFMVISGGAISSATADFGTGGKVLVNSPYALNVIITYVSLFGLIITGALAGQATYQDIDNNCAPFFYTAPLTKFDYLAGRFLGAIAVQLIIFLSIGLGAWLGAHMSWLDPTRLGPSHPAGYFQPYFIFILPNLVFTTAIFFALAALGRKMLPVYVASVLLLIGYLIASQLSTNITVSVPAALADPFGANAIDRITRYWTPFERNSRLIPLAGILLLNRALWMAVGAVILGFTYAKFSFSQPAQRIKRRLQPEAEEEAAGAAALSLPVLHPVFSFSASVRQFLSLTRLQFSETVKNVFFAVLVLAGAVFACVAAGGILDPFAIPVYPVTYRMLEMGGGGFTIFALAIITFYAGELVWRERDAQLNQIVDALPVQRWVLFASKLGALMLVQVLLVLVILIVGLLVQIAHGYYRFELGLYFRDLFGIRLISYWILCVLALFIHTLVNQKYLGHFVVVLYYIATIALPSLGFQHYLYLFGLSPRFIYSDMNGFGPFFAPLFWFHLYWAITAVMLAVITNLIWVRGIESGGRGRLKLAAARFAGPVRLSLATCLILFLAVGGYIFYNTNVLNTYRTTFQNDENRAQYEKKYRQYMSMPQPQITDINIQVDLDPARRVARLQGTEWFENKTDAAIDRVALTIWPEDLAPLPRPHIRVEKLSLGAGQTPLIEDAALGFYLYRFPVPLPPHGRLALDFSFVYPNAGFVNSNPNTDIVSNGSFLNSSYIPFVGYFQDVELTDDSTRHRHGLERAKRLPKLEDVAARQYNAIVSEGDWINFEGTVSTSPDQIAIMPGYLQNEWLEGGRRNFHYKMDAPMMAIGSVNSARYAVQHDRWHDVNLEIYYHPGHEFDLDRMNRSMKATLDYCSAAFSPYQFRQVRIIEFPRYDTFAKSFPNPGGP